MIFMFEALGRKSQGSLIKKSLHCTYIVRYNVRTNIKEGDV